MEAAPAPGLARASVPHKSKLQAPRSTSTPRAPLGSVHRGGTESRETRLPSLFPEAYWVTRRTLACLPRQNRNPEPRRGCGAPIDASSQFLRPHFSDRESTSAQVCSIPWCPSAKDNLCSELETAHVTPELGHQEPQGSIYSAGSPPDSGSSPQEDWCPPWHSPPCPHCALGSGSRALPSRGLL